MHRLTRLCLPCLAVLLLPPAVPSAEAPLIDRQLAPREVSEQSAMAVPGKKPKDLGEGYQHYQRGLVFARQEAWKEAQSAFRNAEKKSGDNLEYQFATAYAHLKLHEPDDALKRYEKTYKKDPTNLRALVGMAASHREAQQYRQEVQMWMRYVKMPIPAADTTEARVLLKKAQQNFVDNYEIAENPTGGADNGLSPADEMELGLMYAKEVASTGVDELGDPLVAAYVEKLCADLVSHAKGFPRKYQVFVLNDPEVQASTVPGFIFVYRGLLDVVKNENQLAGVVAHEIGHSMAHHSAKKFTKMVNDEQSLKSMQQKSGKWAKVLASMMQAGNTYGMLAFSREEEAQADRLAVHVTYDASYSPLGLAEMFQMFESMSPSSRKKWDLMTRTHPFSIDRFNATQEYAALLPPKTAKPQSADFGKMKAKLKTLPPPPERKPTPPPAAAPDRPATSPPPGTPTSEGMRTFQVTTAPFDGEFPVDWNARQAQNGAIVYEGKKGTEAYEASVELLVAPKAYLGPALDDTVRAVGKGLSGKKNIQFAQPEKTDHDGQPAAILRATYRQNNSRSVETPFRHVTLIVQYPEHWVLMSFYLPEDLWDTYVPVFQRMVGRFHMRRK